jgi:serine/threonine protein kinase
MNQQRCDRFELADLLQEDCNVADQRDIEAHLEHCKTCQSRLAELAADAELWTQVASHLSTVSQIELPPRLTSKLNDSTSFVVPTISNASAIKDASNDAFSDSTDWTRILDPPSHPEMLGRIDQFEVDSKIGQGGMGIVLKGFDRELNRAVAIKVLSPQLAINGTARKRFAREAESAAAVMHPNVVPIYSVNKSPTRPYIVMQLVPGHSLQSLVVEKGPLAPKDVVRVSMQIAAGLAAAHKQGLIHRDVKPGNILIERDVSRVMITDFGLARAADDAGMTQTGWLAGTPHYMSPEQSKGDDLDARTDLFSLGSLMYFLATGREPFRGDKPYAVIQKIITKQPTHPTEVNSDVPTTLADIIEKLLEKDPKNRFSTANEVFEALEEYLAYLQQPNKSRPPKRVLTARRKRRRAWVGGASVVGAAAVLGLLGWSLMPNTENVSESITGSSPTAETAIASTPSPEPRPSNAQPNSGSTTPFMFDNAEFSQAFSSELSDLSDELDALEQSLQSTEPMDVGAFGNLPADFPSEIDQFDSRLKSLESSFEFENEQMRQLIERSKQNLTESTSEKELNNEKSTQPNSKGKNDEN